MFYSISKYSGSRDSAVGTATGLDDQGFGVRVPVGSRISLLHVFQTCPGAHPASYPVGTRGYFLGVKLPRREADHSYPIGRGQGNVDLYIHSSIYLRGEVLNSKAQGQFYILSKYNIALRFRDVVSLL
jgi:hypothetical protein